MERRVGEHVAGLLDDRRFVVPTTFGPRPVAGLQRRTRAWDQALKLKQALADAERPDFELQDAMPVGAGLDVSLSRQVLLAFTQPMGHVRYASLAPFRALARGTAPEPLEADEVRSRVNDLPVAGKPRPGEEALAVGGPMTLILFAGGGFTPEARRVAREFVDGPPTILIEPNSAGGYDVTGPPGAEYLVELLDPEEASDRLRRVAAALEGREVDLLAGAVSLDEVARDTRLPIETVVYAAQQWAKQKASAGGAGLRVKRVGDGVMLFRDSSLAGAAGHLGNSSGAYAAGSATMGVMDGLRRFFGGKISPQRRIAQLAEQRALLSRQRDVANDELGRLEDRERELRDAFAADDNSTVRRRITSQIVQLQKDVERRRQTVGVFNQQINVVATQLHNLEIARAGAGSLPTSDEIAEEASKAEDVLAELQASAELADELGAQVKATTSSAEEQRLFEELTAEANAKRESAPASDTPAFAREIPAAAPKASPRATDAPSDATDVSSRATDAPSDATDASSHATDASSHATDASSHATDASSHATDASSHATDASSHATDASSHATDAPSDATGRSSDATDDPSDATNDRSDVARVRERAEPEAG